MTAPHYDALILGGGTAGCVLAGRLSENPDYRVCLVEAGPDYGHFSADRWPADILDARWLALSHSWDRDHDDPWQLRARILGGCSAHNLCVVLEGAPEDYDEWGAGWSYAEFAPYLHRARETLRTSLPTTETLSPWHKAFFDAGGADAIAHPANRIGTVRWNAAFAYIDPARERQNLTIRDRTLVHRILLDGRRAYGALTSAGEIHADTVVLTSGAYGSPGVLLRSQIGPACGLPVGEGLRDHVGVGLEFQATATLQREMNAFAARSPLFMGQVTLRARSRSCPEGLHDLLIFPAVDAEHSISVAVVAVKPRSTGTVRINEGDPESPLAINHGFLSEPADIAMLADGIDILRRLIAKSPICNYVVRETVPGEHVRSSLYATVAARGFYHPVGTCAIGAVVDSAGAVYGFDGLIVADASIIPTIPRANTNLTVAAIAERIAVLLHEGDLSHA